MRDEPFTGTKYPNKKWALKVLREWKKVGYPDLIGPPAEQIRLAWYLHNREVYNGEQ